MFSRNMGEGFRLHNFEVYNWGPFHHKIWNVDFHGENTLLTGQNGTGKSTLVDALTTLLVPYNKITYNAAGGAAGKERKLATYVLGRTRTVSDESMRDCLRDRNDYTVILAVFKCAATEKTVSLAQFIYFASKDDSDPQRIFVGSNEELSIAEDFTNFDGSTVKLRRILRQKDCEVFENFKQYSVWYRTQMNLSQKAIDLLYQTISMRNISDITSFVRDNMLEAFDISPAVQSLVDHFEDLNVLYQNVVKAREQIQELKPVQELSEKLKVSEQEVQRLNLAQENLDSFVRTKLSEVLLKAIRENDTDLQKSKAVSENLELQIAACEGQKERIREQIAEKGGYQLGRLKETISNKKQLLSAKERAFHIYDSLLWQFDERGATDLNTFFALRNRIEAKKGRMEEERTALEKERDEHNIAGRKLQEKVEQLQDEIDNLRKHDSNIPLAQIKIRRDICDALDIDDEALPFAGELLQVKASEKEIWEGAVERVLHGFALSMMVPQEHYKDVVHYVNTHNLKGRLVFFKAFDLESNKQSISRVEDNSLFRKVEIKSDSRFHKALNDMLLQRFNIPCFTEAQEDEFRLAREGVSSSGQIKSRNRHEKDDRKDLYDRRNYVLGWSNKAKLKVLQQQFVSAQKELTAAAGKYAKILHESDDLRRKIDVAGRILTDYTDFTVIDTAQLKSEIVSLNEELERISKGNADLQSLREQEAQISAQIKKHREEINKCLQDQGRIEGYLKNFNQELSECRKVINLHPVNEQAKEYLENLYSSNKAYLLTPHKWPERRQEMSDEMHRRYTHAAAASSELKEKIVSMLSTFNSKYPAETKEFSSSAEGLPEYMNFLKNLEFDNLPKYEERFKQQLKVNSIRDMVQLSATLDEQLRDMKDGIDQINESLFKIDYNYGTYIKLNYANTNDVDVMAFRQDMRNCVSNSAGEGQEQQDSLQFAEAKFALLKELIDRLKGRPGSADADRNWRKKVTDVRNWMSFSATEFYREDNSEKEFYRDSGGKSGGQKEKLAYTILGAAMAYQYGINAQDPSESSEAFRFFMIDEAFSKGSEMATEYALNLFKTLQLQLLVATPMLKINVIAPYISTVCYVTGKEGQPSSVHNMTVAHYQKQMEEREMQRAQARLQQRAEQALTAAQGAQAPTAPAQGTEQGETAADAAVSGSVVITRSALDDALAGIREQLDFTRTDAAVSEASLPAAQADDAEDEAETDADTAENSVAGDKEQQA